MILHTHLIDDKDTYVLHVTRHEAKALMVSLSNAMDNNPDDENFSITLGHYAEVGEDALTHEEE